MLDIKHSYKMSMCTATDSWSSKVSCTSLVCNRWKSELLQQPGSSAFLLNIFLGHTAVAAAAFISLWGSRRQAFEIPPLQEHCTTSPLQEHRNIMFPDWLQSPKACGFLYCEAAGGSLQLCTPSQQVSTSGCKALLPLCIDEQAPVSCKPSCAHSRVPEVGTAARHTLLQHPANKGCAASALPAYMHPNSTTLHEQRCEL